MLEEALRSTTYSPAEAALALLSFVQVELPAGGASAEARFFQLFPLLCDRVFGPLSKGEDKDIYRHQIGGWLSRDVKWERPSSSLSSSQRSFANRVGVHPSKGHISTLSSDPVVKLLGIARQSSSKQQLPQNLIEAFTKEAEHRPNVRYSFPFQALPKAMQDAWLTMLEASLTGAPSGSNWTVSENSKCLLGSLLRVKPIEQVELRSYLQKKALKIEHRRPLQLSPGYPSPVSPTAFQQASKEKDNKDAPPGIKFSMLEYFLIVFIRYPLAAPSLPPKQQRTHRGVQIPPRNRDHYGESVYYFLFDDYLHHFIPRNRPCGHFTGFENLSRPSELFLSIIIQLWMEGQNQLDSTSKSVEVLQERRVGPVDPLACGLNMSYDLVSGRYNPPPCLVQKCIRKLVIRVISDGAMLDAAKDLHAGFGNVPEPWCLSPSITILQLPFYNYVRSAFRNASIHTKQSPFFDALNTWLIWLEPWKLTNSKSNTVASKSILESVSRVGLEMKLPTSSQSNRYKPSWEPYIAANLHLYTVPLALFLRRSRELDFSSREFRTSLKVVQRVLRVYSPAVVEVINRLLLSRKSEYVSPLVAKHEKNLGAHAPSLDWELSLSSCREDMHNLLEEIYLQHMKKIGELDLIEQWFAKFEAIFGQGTISGEEKELQALVDRAKIIVGFPSDYEVAPTFGKDGIMESRVGKDDCADDDGAYGAILSQSTRQRILDGSFKCSPLAMTDFGDTMTRRPHSHEIAFLVPLLIRASNFLNIRMGLVQENRGGQSGETMDFLARAREGEESRNIFRINLRFLADYRNLIFICVLSWFWQLLAS